MDVQSGHFMEILFKRYIVEMVRWQSSRLQIYCPLVWGLFSHNMSILELKFVLSNLCSFVPTVSLEIKMSMKRQRIEKQKQQIIGNNRFRDCHIKMFEVKKSF